MRVWRCVKRVHLEAAYSGEGAEGTSGRWHTRGTRIVYASESAALAALEAAVNVGSVRRLVALYLVCPAEVPDDAVTDLAEPDLPDGWNAFPHPPTLQAVGDRWVHRGGSVAVRVPSAVVPGRNVLLNPGHPDFGEVRVKTEEASEIAPGRPT